MWCHYVYKSRIARRCESGNVTDARYRMFKLFNSYEEKILTFYCI
jgi:hypothetical protein